MSHRIVLIGGPTAAGKSRVAMQLARDLGGELVSADSVQVFRGFDIGSAKPSAAERAEVPHHLIDICDPDDVYSAARFVHDADEAIAGIAARGKVPIVVGGTGLYLRSLIHGLFEAPQDDAAKAMLRARAEAEGAPALHRELERVDPEAAGRIGVNDAVRVVRALEVYHAAGRPISALQREHGLAEQRHPSFNLTLTRPRGSLDSRIAARAAAMLDAGLETEVRDLLAAGVSPSSAPMRSLGYRQVSDRLAAVDAGVGSADSAPESAERAPMDLALEIRIATRRFAKRQLTWFRRQWTSRWLNLDEGVDSGALTAAARRWIDGDACAEFGYPSDATFR